MELEVLGNCGGSPGPGGACSGYLVQDGSTCLLLDCGPGIVASLQRSHHVSDVSAIYISHMHADHCLDLWTLAFRLSSTWRRDGIDLAEQRPIPLFVPSGGADMLHDWEKVLIPSRLAQTFEVHERSPREQIRVAGMTLSCFPTEHGVLCQGVRVASESGQLAYSGDTRLFADLPELAEGTDLFLCEASGRSPDEFAIVTGMHLTARQAATIAQTAGTAKLLLTHLVVHNEQYRQSLQTDAAEHFDGPVEVAELGRSYAVDTRSIL